MDEIQLALTNPNELTLDHKSNGEQCDCVPQADEMHDQYLNRLEALFIKQLHQSTGWLARWPNWSVKRNLLENQPNKKASEQFTVFRDGCWERINFGRATTTDSRDVFKSPWVKRFKHGDKSCSSCLPDVSECSKNHHVENQGTSANGIKRYSADMLIDETCFSNSVGSISEGSGQNFAGEDCDNGATFRVKKLKLSVADSPSADQIVPSTEIDAKIHPAIGKITAEDQDRNGSLLEEYRNNAITEPVLQSFLRGH